MKTNNFGLRFFVICLGSIALLTACDDTEKTDGEGIELDASNDGAEVYTIVDGVIKNSTTGGSSDGNDSSNAADGADGTDKEDGADGVTGKDGTDSERTTGTDSTGGDLPKDFGEPCENNDQCDDSFCIDGPDGKICTTTCIDWCPEDFACEGVTNFGSDVTYICVPKYAALCSECTSDADCGSDSCVAIEGEGSFCSRECSVEEPCPNGYACKIIDDLVSQCFPNTGSCICTEELLGKKEPCFNQNSFGVCAGNSTCAGPGGWTECDALIPSQEICDGIDNDCDNDIDEKTGGAACEKSNEFGVCSGALACNGVQGLACTAKEPAAEICDAIDNDCDGTIDEPDAAGCTVYYEDFDQDGVGNSLTALCLCGPVAKYTTQEGGDCNDLNPNVTGGKPEICNNLDDNCDGEVDPEGSTGCVEYYQDADGDGYGTAKESKCLCQPSGTWKALIGGDCDDSNPKVFPQAQEICNSIDDNCDGSADESGATGCEPYLKDADDDGYGVTGLSQCLCAPAGAYKAKQDGDCNDDNKKVNPLAFEICDGVDNNCNGFFDEQCDKDNDGYCNAQKKLVGNPPSCPLGGGDCVDYDPNIHPNAVEVCDEVDNNCNDEIDEGVQAPCGGCEPVCLISAGPKEKEDGGSGFDKDPEGLNGAGFDDDGNVVLDVNSVNLHAIWIANSGQGTISKLDTDNGNELARYNLCNDPSRTAVDSLGNAWIACRGDGAIVKVMISEADCIDKNGDGVIQTSKDVDGNGKIEGAEMLGKDQDECVLFKIQPDGSGGLARAMGVDAENNGWAGMWNTNRLWRIDGNTGLIMQKIDIPNNPYGLAIAQDGIIWVAGRGGSKLVRVDPKDGNIQSFVPNIGCFDPYGITIDGKGRIWIGNCCCDHVAYRFDPSNNKWSKAGVGARPRGIAAAADGFIYVANDESSRVTKINSDTMNVAGVAELGGGRFPVGMAVDFDGKVWAVNQKSSTASRIDPKSMNVEFEKPTGKSPYTYSDMTGFQQKTVVAPFGTYRHTFTGWDLAASKTRWQQVGFNASTPEGTFVKLRARAADTKEALKTAEWTPFFGPFPPELPPVDLSKFGLMIGAFLEVEVTLGSQAAAASTPILKSLDIVLSEYK